MGRPTKYRPEYVEQAEKLCKLGMIEKEIAAFFEITERTLNTWKQSFPEFLHTLKGAKTLADAEVASKLFHRATGYSHADVDIRVIDSKIVVTELVKHYPPDTAAAIFWLKNRQPAKWRDKPADDVQDDDMPVSVKVTVQDGRKS